MNLKNLFAYIQAFSPAFRDIFERFEFYAQLDRLSKAGLLYLVTERFAHVDLHPDKIPNSQMGHPESYAICKADMLIKGEPSRRCDPAGSIVAVDACVSARRVADVGRASRGRITPHLKERAERGKAGKDRSDKHEPPFNMM